MFIRVQISLGRAQLRQRQTAQAPPYQHVILYVLLVCLLRVKPIYSISCVIKNIVNK